MLDVLTEQFQQIMQLPEARQREVALAISAVASGEVTLCQARNRVEEATFPPGFWDKADDLQTSVLLEMPSRKKKVKATAELAASIEAARSAPGERQAAIALLLRAVIDQDSWDILPAPNLRASVRQVVEQAVRPRRRFNTAKEMIESIVNCANARRELHSWRKRMPLTPEMKSLIDYLAEQAVEEYVREITPLDTLK